ncbi:MAG: hypothetical protein MMC33_001554 [Icmadophila ericetorum]|nr:hypothetical protein [Icmadophila ericetorum]
MAVAYNKGSNHISATKMNYFHYFLKQLTGYTLHPSIETTARSTGRIADLGTQTAIWPIDVADDHHSLSTGEIDAFDISDAFFPPSAWLPPNVKLHLHDIYKPFPEQFRGQFDIIHLRLFLTLSKSQVDTILQNAMTLLKPNGYIQWTEHDKTSITPTSTSPDIDLATSAAQHFIDLQKQPFPNYDALWVNSIAPLMQSAGLSVIAEDRIKVRQSMLSQINELHLLSLMDVPKGLSKAIDAFRDDGWLEKLKGEYKKGVSTVDGFIVVVGKKAKSSEN